MSESGTLWKKFWPSLLLSIIILALSATPGSTLPRFSFNDLFSLDKLGHFLMYAALCFSILRGFAHAKEIIFLPKKAYLYAFLWSTSYGILMECFQYSFLPDRYFEVLDIIANIIGALAGSLIFLYFFNNK